MPLYEHVYMARQDLSAQQVEEMTASFKGVIEGLGGKFVSDPEYWGVKSLSFRIKKNRKAHFTMLKLDAPPAALAEDGDGPDAVQLAPDGERGIVEHHGGDRHQLVPRVRNDDGATVAERHPPDVPGGPSGPGALDALIPHFENLCLSAAQ